MTSFQAYGYVAEFSLPAFVAKAFQRPVAVAVHATGKKAALGAVVTLVAHVASIEEKNLSKPQVTLTSSS